MSEASSQQERDTLIMQWMQAEEVARDAKFQATLLYKQVLSVCFPTLHKGTNRLELGHGWELKAVHKQNIKIDKKAAEDDYAALKAVVEKIPQDLVAGFLRYEYKISATGYNNLPKQYQDLLNTVVTISDSGSTLEVVDPNKKAK